MADAKVQEDVPKDSVNPINCEEEKVEESMDVNIENGLGQRTGFSSENFKIEIANLPRFFGVSQAKKFLMKTMGLKVHKIKPCGKKATWMFVNFANEEDRELAIAKLDGFKLKGHKLRAFKAKAAKDPMAKKAAASDQEEQVDDRPVDEQLKAAVCPLSDQSYCDQLKAKTEIVKDLMANLRKEFMKSNGFFKDHGITEATLAKLEPFVPSPVTQGYRNKCEFTVGLHPETKKATVGFRLASYKKGSVAVVGIDHLPMVSDVMKKVVKHFENFVLASGYEPFDNIGQSGYWKQLTVREGQRTGDLLVWAISHPQNLSEDDKSALKDKLKKHFSETTVDDVPQVTSLSVQFLGRRVKGEPDPPIELLHGQPSIRESLMGLSFKISPQAFFQVNTEAAEILYKTVGEIANLDKDTVAFDVCCGTGTIGLCLADKAKHVDGLDIIEEAVEDANANAKANGVNNATFHAGRAEFLLSDLLKKYEGQKTVAIVDPPRAGLHPKAVFALRASDVKKLVYVSCDAKAAMHNFVHLGKMPSKQYKGDPFFPSRVIPVDLFPHTRHFELVILFERYPLKEKLLGPTDQNTTE